jgi:hypothetical protein
MNARVSGIEEHLLQWLQDLLRDTPKGIAEIKESMMTEPERITHA